MVALLRTIKTLTE